MKLECLSLEPSWPGPVESEQWVKSSRGEMPSSEHILPLGKDIPLHVHVTLWQSVALNTFLDTPLAMNIRAMRITENDERSVGETVIW
jgi:hypothetical protein